MNFFPQIGQVLSFQSIFSVFIAILLSNSVFVSALTGKIANSQINSFFALSGQEQDDKLNNAFHLIFSFSVAFVAPFCDYIVSHCDKFVNRFLKNILDFFNFYFQVPLQKAIFAPHDRNNVLGRENFEPMRCLCFTFRRQCIFHTCLLVLSTAELKKSSRSKLCSVSAAFGFPKSFRSHVLTAAFQSFIGFLPTFQPLAV